VDQLDRLNCGSRCLRVRKRQRGFLPIFFFALAYHDRPWMSRDCSHIHTSAQQCSRWERDRCPLQVKYLHPLSALFLGLAVFFLRLAVSSPTSSLFVLFFPFVFFFSFLFPHVSLFSCPVAGPAPPPHIQNKSSTLLTHPPVVQVIPFKSIPYKITKHNQIARIGRRRPFPSFSKHRHPLFRQESPNFNRPIGPVHS